MKPPLSITDTHCHLDQYAEPPDLNAAATRVIGVTLSPLEYTAWMERGGIPAGVFPAVGLFPENIQLRMAELDQALELIQGTRFIGEIGLDYVTQDEAERDLQRKAFDAILEAAAAEGDRVLTIHSRRSAKDVVERFKEGFPGTPILHWFSGDFKLAEKVLDTCWFSVNTAMVGSEHGRDFIRQLPRDRILLESDGPYIQVEERPAQPRDLERIIQFFSGEWAMPLVETAALLEWNAEQALFSG
jgi:TatD DNase family protein